jgi:glycogen phosphorylase
VTTTICDPLQVRLRRLAYNWRWSWTSSAAQVFASLAPDVWQATHNPIAVLEAVDDCSLQRHADAIDAAVLDLRQYLASAPAGLPRVAYLSAEFAISECLPIYAGGLGVLAGDHLKSASDLGLPLVGIGLLYRYGYFRQTLDASSSQRECYDQLDPTSVPLRPVVGLDGRPLRIAVPLARRTVVAGAWRADVGRVRLYLLDTNLPENDGDDRWITAHAYGGDRDTRIRQEIVLGIGGARLLRALYLAGHEPTPGVYHLNEGHSALLVLELARDRLLRGGAGSFSEAIDEVAEHVVFTTHTPVAAGHDAFPPELIETYLGDYARQLGLDMQRLLCLARRQPDAGDEPFSMTILALRGAARRNAVSRLHGRTSRQMWRGVGVGVSDEPARVEMDAITNGVHGPTWAGPEMSALFDGWLGQRWRMCAREPTTWSPLADVPPRLLWEARTAQRARLLARAGCTVDPSAALVLGFARRFASYKRAALLLEDPDRLARLLGDGQHGTCVLIFAGKAHPQDDMAKHLLQRIVAASRDKRFRGRLLFVENYDLELARLMVQGSDVWLNTPRRPLEASGTSGMKAALNGALQLSELDGWWDEAFRAELGWALGAGLSDHFSDRTRDAVESRQLLDLLERLIAPLYFARDGDGLPRAWLRRVIRSIVALAPTYSAERMVLEYAERMYVPARPRKGPTRELVRAANRRLQTDVRPCSGNRG